MEHLNINYIKGDATSCVYEGKKLIIHICNDIGGWGRGFVLALSQKWSKPESEYRRWFESKDKFELGNIQTVQVEEDIWVGNMIAQRHTVWSEDGTPPIRYEAVEKCLKQIAVFAIENNMSIHMPRIGCGLAGGKWEHIEPIINGILVSEKIPVFVYDFE